MCIINIVFIDAIDQFINDVVSVMIVDFNLSLDVVSIKKIVHFINADLIRDS